MGCEACTHTSGTAKARPSASPRLRAAAIVALAASAAARIATDAAPSADTTWLADLHKEAPDLRVFAGGKYQASRFDATRRATRGRIVGAENTSLAGLVHITSQLISNPRIILAVNPQDTKTCQHFAGQSGVQCRSCLEGTAVAFPLMCTMLAPSQKHSLLYKKNIYIVNSMGRSPLRTVWGAARRQRQRRRRPGPG